MRKIKYKADPSALWKSVARCTGFNDAEQTQCALPGRLAWEALKSGTADSNDIATMADVIAICITAAQGMDDLVQDVCNAARDALAEIADRFTRLQRWGVDANALRDIPPVIDLYEELLRNATGGQFEQWIGCVRTLKNRVELTA